MVFSLLLNLQESTLELSSVPVFLYASALILVTWIASSTIRNQWFHPLRSIPGPWFNSISEIPATIALVLGRQQLYYQSLHNYYGPVVRIAPGEVSFISAAAREEIHGIRKGGLNMEKSPIFLGAVSSMNGEKGVSLAVGAEHTRQRRALGYLFTNTALLRHEHIIKSHINKLIGIFQDAARSRAPHKLYRLVLPCGLMLEKLTWGHVEVTYVSFDIMGDLCFAEPFGCLEHASATEWSTSVINVFISATWTQAIRRLAGVDTYLEAVVSKLLIPASAAKWRAIHLEKSREKTLQRLNDEERDHKDFMYHILKNDTHKALTKTEIVLNMASFISAGSDTAATVLSGWTYFMCTHPDAYKRVVTEVRAIRREEDIKWEVVKDLEYLEATIQEALRLLPPSPASQQRVVPSGGATIDDYYIPAGSTVSIAPWVATRSELNFYEPLKFKPERWITGPSRGKFENDQLGASLPFGTGPQGLHRQEFSIHGIEADNSSSTLAL